MSEFLEVALRTPWSFLGTSVFIFLGSFSIALSYYWLTRYREFQQSEIERRKAHGMSEIIREIISRGSPSDN